MGVPFELRIDDEILGRLPGIRLTALLFEGVRLGVPSRKIEPLRERVISGARERIAAIRDPRRIPAIAAFHDAFPEIARTSRRPWLDEAYRSIARRDPFQVANDVVDSARLLSLHYGVPILALDRGKVRPPVAAAVAPAGATARTPQGTSADLSDLPVLSDASGPLASPIVELGRAAPSRQTKDVILVAWEPGREGLIDVEDLKTRASNWLGSLAGARLAGTYIAGS